MLHSWQLRKNLNAVKETSPITSLEQTKLLADPRRMRLLRYLMASPATLTQLAQKVDQSPAWVRHHIQKLADVNLVEQAEIRVRGTVTEKYYRAKAGAFLLQKVILPEGNSPVLLFSGSDDLILREIAEALSPHLDIILHPVGSLDGLINLRQGLCHLSGAHLLDESGIYNTPYIRRIFPDREMQAFTLAHRTQGLILPAGNPRGIRSVADVVEAGCRLRNRNPGSGTRLWLDTTLKELGISPKQIRDYDKIAYTHNDAARAVAAQQADVALGLEAAAKKYDLDFIPLFNEQYDLILPAEITPALDILLNHLQSAQLKQAMAAFRGYESAHTGEAVPL